MDAVLRWLTALPPLALYAALAVAGATENFFPVLPADTVVAFGSFLAAREHAAVLGAFLATWAGNVAGAMTVFGIAHRYAGPGLQRRLARYGSASRQRRLESLYRRHGLWALFVSRFLPGVRALVPPFAGAMRTPALPVAVVISVASAIWYGLITWAAYRVGANWDTLRERVGQLSRGTALVAAVLAAAGLIAAWAASRRRRAP